MIPTIKKIGYRWEVRCRNRLRSFSSFGLSPEMREHIQTLPVTFLSWIEAVDYLCGLYRSDLVIK